MLESVEVFPRRRRSSRRASSLRAKVYCGLWDGPVEHLLRDLSFEGAFLQTPLAIDEGTEVVVELDLGGERSRLTGVVRRAVLRRRDGERHLSGLGIEWVSLPLHLRARLKRALGTLPPPLPGREQPTRREWVWVESILTWEEDVEGETEVTDLGEMMLLSSREIDSAFGDATALADHLN